MQNSYIRVNEIFTSLQGEGRCQGYPCTFIRLSGCNLACTWCDTPASRDFSGTETRCDEVFSAVEKAGNRLVCITGGEPLLQTDALVPLLEALHDRGYTVEIETNGTMPLHPVQPFATICMDVKCPSSGMESDLRILDDIREEDSVKFVVTGEPDLEYASEIMNQRRIRGEVFVSPVWGSDYRETAVYLVQHRLPARLQVQLHKVIGVR